MSTSKRSDDGGSPAAEEHGVLPRRTSPGLPRPVKSSFLLAETILNDIARQGLRPGDPLPTEKAMVEKYGLGRGTVREALRLLEYQGAVAIRQGINGGPVVQEPDSSHFASTVLFMLQMQRTPFESIVEVRLAVEPVICRLAAERIGEDALAELAFTIDEMKRHAGDIDDQVMNEMNSRFHNIIAWSSGNTLFRYLADSLLDIMNGAVVGVTYSPVSRAGVIAAHERILRALTQHDGASAETGMYRHLRGWEEYMSHEFPNALDRVVPWSWSGTRRLTPPF